MRTMKDNGSLRMSEVGYHSTQAVLDRQTIGVDYETFMITFGGRLFIVTTELARCHRKKLLYFTAYRSTNASRRKYIAFLLRGKPNNPNLTAV